MTERRARANGLWWVAGGALILGWLLGEWLGPRLVASAYREESLPILNRVIGGRDVHSLEFYLTAWRRLLRTGTAALALALGLARLAFAHQTELRNGLREALSAGPTVRPAVYLWMAAWFGALSGVAQATHLSVRHLAEREPRGFAWDLAWLPPLSSSLAFAVLAALSLGIIGVVRRGARGPLRLRPWVFVFAFVACYGVLESQDFRLAGYAVLLLCAGLAASAARAAGSGEATFRKMLRVSTPVVGLLLAIGVVAGLLTRPAARERRALASLPSPRAGLSNVLLVILDTVRADDMGLYGYHRANTPNLSTWADSGVVFDRAISTAPWTLTSHASMFTGHLPHELSADFRAPLDDTYPTLAEALRDEGYATGGFVANLGYTSRQSGLARGFARYEDFPLALGRFVTTSWLPRWLVTEVFPLPVKRWAGADTPQEYGKKSGEQVTDAFLHWARERDDRPFFAFLNYMDAHTPYIPPEPYDGMYVAPGMDVSRVARHPDNSLEQMRGQRALYDGAIAYMDRELGRLFEELRDLGRLQNTLVIVTSDHGEQFGEHGLIGHGASLYMPVVHVPLLVVFPGRVPPAVRVPGSVTLRDLPATILDLLGVNEARAFPGRSLGRFWREAEPRPTAVFSQVNVVPIARTWEPSFKGPMASLILGDLHLIRDGAGDAVLYDLVRDPGEEVDLMGRPEFAERAVRLETALDSILGAGLARNVDR